MRRIGLMTLGFVAAFTGDWFLAIRACGVREPGYLCGIAAFACAHLLWGAANWRETKVEWKVLPVVLFPLIGLFATRIWGRVPLVVFAAGGVYAVVSACSLAVAVGTRRWCYAFGIGCLVLSDVFIACTWLKAPHWRMFIGPTYVSSLVLIAMSLVWGKRERRFVTGDGNPLPMVAVLGLLSAALFVWAMVVCPGGDYNPLRRMLSYLGRTEIKKVAYPLTHYLFIAGMAAGAAASLYFLPYFRSFASGRVRRTIVGWGMTVCAGGLLLIAAVPENVNMFGHNTGCHLAAIGGGAVALSLMTDRVGRIAGAWMLLTVAVFFSALLLDIADIIPFSPGVPSAQKLVIVSFMLWQLVYAALYPGKH